MKQEVWPDTMPDLKPTEEVADFEEESSHAFVDLEERESADSVVDFEEESAHAFVDLEEWESADSVADCDEESDDTVLVAFER